MHQWLLVNPGKYEVNVTRKGQTIWSGPVTVEAGQRAVIYLNDDGKIKMKSFKKGLTLGPQPRFYAGARRSTLKSRLFRSPWKTVNSIRARTPRSPPRP